MKNKKAKLLSVLLCATMVSGVFASCAKEEVSVEHTGQISQGIDKTTLVDKLIENGQSDYIIVIPEESNECIDYAAQELNDFLEKATGVRLPVKKDSQVSLTLKSHIISLGDTSFYDISGINVDTTTFNYDGFIMKTVQENLFIKGYRNSGVLYGVYDFLEQFIGIRFLASDYTYIPKLTEVSLWKTDRVEIPAFANRDYYAQQSMQDKAFTSRLRIESAYGEFPAKYGEGGTNLFTIGEGHTTINRLMPIETYYDAHPEWYATGMGDNDDEICFTNGITVDGKIDFNNENGLAREMYYRCVEELEANPVSRILMIGQQDSPVWCECDVCEESYEIYKESGTMMIFVNALAEELEKWGNEHGRTVDVMTMAYGKSIDPPTIRTSNEDGTEKFVPTSDKVVARKNVLVKFAWMGCNKHGIDDSSCQANKTAHNRLKGWQSITDRFTIWDYATNYDTNFWWFENFESFVDNFKFYRNIGVEGLLTQGAPHASNYYQGHLENYLFAKLSWNPEYDVNELVADFNNHYYADNVAGVNEFVRLMRLNFNTLDETLQNGFHTQLYASGNMRDADLWPVSLLEKAENAIRNEITALKNREDMSEEEKRGREDRLLQALIQPMFMTLWNYDSYYDPSGKIAYAKEFFQYTDRLELQYYGEGRSISDLKLTYGV